MHYYPLFLDIREARCLIVGAGKVGLRKAAALLECDPALVLVLDTAPLDLAWDTLVKTSRLVFEQRPFTADDVRGCTLVFAATSSRAVNAAVHAACLESGVLCNVADAPEDSRFIVPACVRHARLTVALSTGGASPALARKMRRDLAQRLREGYAPLADVLARLRPLVLALEPSDEQTLPNSVNMPNSLQTNSEKALNGKNTLPSKSHDLPAVPSVLSSSCSPATALASSSSFFSTGTAAESLNVPLIGQEARAALFRAVADSGLADSLARGDRAECEALLRHILPKMLHAHITELLYGLA